MKLRLALMLALLAAALLLVQGAPAGSKAVYYVSLGDSLAQGFQPKKFPPSPEPDKYKQGYADQLYRLIRHDFQQLRGVKLGCGGETTVTFRTGGICSYDQGSQLADAAAFLQQNAGRVVLVTIDIGANDVLSGGGAPAIAANLPVILATLQAAAGPDVPIIAMNYYDPFVAPVWFQTQSLAALQAEVAQTVGFNDFLEGIYGAFGIEVADVEQAFSVTDLTLVNGTPLNVIRACEWTWACAGPPVNFDIHANTEGYGVIAETFLGELHD